MKMDLIIILMMIYLISNAILIILGLYNQRFKKFLANTYFTRFYNLYCLCSSIVIAIVIFAISVFME